MKPPKLFHLTCIVTILLITDNSAKHIQKRGIMDNVNDGLKYAGQMFGINTAADVANLVAKAFSTTANRGKPDLLSFIQKGFQTPLSSYSAATSSEDTKQTENNDRSEESPSPSSSSSNQQFQTKSTSPTGEENLGLNLNTMNFVTGMLRMVGFDATKLGALAINALVMVASAIGTTLLGATQPQPTKSQYPQAEHDHDDNKETGPEEEYSPTEHQPRKLKEGTPIDWFLQNPSKKMKGLLDDAIDSSLSDKITNMIANYETAEGQGACLKMLMCKSSPIIWGMQKSLKKRIEGGTSREADDTKSEESRENPANQRLFNVESFFTHLPSLDEFREHGAKCEQLYSNHCNTTDLYRRKLH